MPRARAVALLLAATAAQAQAGIEFEAQALRSRYDAFEPGPGGQGVYNREQGRLQGGGAALRWQAGTWALEARVARREGTLVYEGLTQLGLPLLSSTRLRWDEVALQLHRGGSWGPAGTRWALQGGFEGLVLQRAIQPTPLTGALTETLRRHGPAAGLRLEQPVPLPALGLWSLAAGWHWSRPWRQTLDVDAHGVFDPLRLAPAHGTNRAWQLALRWTPAPGWTLALQGTRQRLEVGGAGLQPVWHNGALLGAVSYPGSQQRSRHTLLTLAWQP
jgi:hypothetical protein